MPGRRRSRPLAVLRGFFGAIGWMLFAVVALVMSAWVHVFTPVARPLLRDLVLDQVNSGIRGRIAIGHIDELDFGRIGVSHLEIYDPEGRRVLSVDEASVELDPLTFTPGSITLDAVSAKDGELHLIETPEGLPSIAAAFESVEPQPETDEPGMDFAIDEIDIEGLRVTHTYEPASDLSVAELAVAGSLSISEGDFSMEVTSAGFGLEREGRKIGRLESLEASFDGGEGTVVADAALVLGDGRIELEAEAELPQDPNDPSAEPQLVATVNVSDLGPADVEALGLFETGPWVGEVGGRIHFDGTPQTFTAEADVTTPGGDVHAEARMVDGDRVEATVRTDGFAPARVLAGVAAPPISGKISADVTGLATPETLDVETRVTDLTAGPWHVPSLHAAAHVANERVRIDELRLPYLQGDVDVTGTVGFDGAVDVHVDANVPELAREPNLKRLMPELRGGLDATVDVEVHPSEGDAAPRLAVRGEAELRDARVGPLSAGRLRVSGSMQGRADAPVVDATVSGQALALPEQDIRLSSLNAEVVGGPDAYDVTARATGPEGQGGRLDGRIARRGQGWIVDANGSARDLLGQGRQWSLDARRVELEAGGSVRIGSAEVTSGDMRARVSGVYRPSGESDLDLEMEKIDLAFVAEMLGLERLDGSLDGNVDFGGSPDRPELEVVAVYSGDVQGVRIERAELAARLSSDAGTLGAELAVDLARYGALEVNAEGSFTQGRREPLVDALRDGTYQVGVEAREVSLALANVVAPDAPSLHGTVDGEIEAAGDLEQPSLTFSLTGTDLGMGEPSELDVQLAGSYDDRQTRVHLVARDGEGALGQAELTAELDARALIESPPADPLQLARSTKWALSVQTDARRLDQLPPPARVDVPAEVAATLHVQNEPGLAPVVDADVGVTWLGQIDSCEAFDTPRARARMRLYEGETRVELIGRLGTEQVLGAVATAETPVDAWLEHGLPEQLPEVSLRADIERLSLSRLPVACDVASGTLQGAIEAEHLLTDAPEISVALYGTDLRYHDMPPSRLVLRADADDDSADVLMEMSTGERSSLRAEAQMPLVWRNGVPELSADSTIDARVLMDDFHLEPLGAIPALAFAEGRLDGRIDIHGPVSEPEIGGRIELLDVGFGLVNPAQRFSDGTGAIVFHDGWIELDSVELHDLEGTLRASGSIGLDGLTPDAVQMGLYVDDLPIRQEGMPVGNLDVTATVRAEVREEEIEVWIETDDMSIEVPEELRTNIQQLDPHEDIVVYRGGERVGAEEEEEATELVPKDIIIHVDATDPFWVRRTDFALQVQASLDVKLVGTGIQVGGWVEFRRGYLELLGKRFDLEEGRIEFLGGRELNPRVDLLLAHDLASSPGDQVFIRIKGHLQQPELEFSSTIPGVSTPGEVLALLAGRGGGAGSEQTAGDQATSALAGVTAGILTLTARRELGDVMPDISVEATDGGARLRAGFDANQLIPEFLSGVILGAYVEGFVGSGSGDGGPETQDTRSGGAGGFLIEFLLPYDFTFTTEVQPPSAASADVMWEP